MAEPLAADEGIGAAEADIGLDDLIEVNGHLSIPPRSGKPMTTEEIRELRLSLQR